MSDKNILEIINATRDPSRCCDRMKEMLNQTCDQHKSPFDCPDQLIYYTPKFDEYGLIVHDGGQSCIRINFCPWCGSKLPSSRRNEWFDQLEDLGFEDPFADEIPEKYKSDAWYRD